MIILTLHEIPDVKFDKIMRSGSDPKVVWDDLLADIGYHEGVFITHLDYSRKRALERVHEFVVNYEACDDE